MRAEILRGDKGDSCAFLDTVNDIDIADTEKHLLLHTCPLICLLFAYGPR